MMLSLIIISGMLSEQCFRGIEIRRHLPKDLFANHPSTASFVITNRKARFPAFSLHVMDIVSGTTLDRGVRLLYLPPRTSARQPYPLLILRRGRYCMEGVRLLTRFPFGFFIKATTLPLPAEMVVYPQIRALPSALLGDLAATGYGDAVLQRGQGAGLHNLRTYLPGDDSRAIHWKTTARKTQLIVRETESEHQQQVTLALYTGPSRLQDEFKTASQSVEEAFEQAVTLTASLAYFYHQQGYQIRLLVGEDELSHGNGGAHFYRLLTLLALCEPTDTLPSRAIQSLQRRTVESEYTVVILSVSDPSVLKLCPRADRILIASDLN
jgi:uncharacterized protein (DUF58 family)